MRSAFGEEVTSHATDQVVNVARLARNAIVHAGGRLDDKLRGMQHGLVGEDGVLQIMAADTKRLFDELKERATKLTDKAITLPEIKGGAQVAS